MPRMVESATRFRFTQKVLEALPPHDANSSSSQLELCDVECVGLRLNVSKTGRKFWFLRYRWRNRKRTVRLSPCSMRMHEQPGALPCAAWGRWLGPVVALATSAPVFLDYLLVKVWVWGAAGTRLRPRWRLPHWHVLCGHNNMFPAPPNSERAAIVN